MMSGAEEELIPLLLGVADYDRAGYRKYVSDKVSWKARAARLARKFEGLGLELKR